ncbi:ABC transporter permease [Bogoriella caseilytica]|uniref:ABC-2 type transport system permease protein n=1 Tax=Bogoriella caseilytica TaxID=56055 RepID=A0A3N2BAG0_9MICO|nr:ABC transporter permease [Bogoriella caseilytica]ROR72178.1 ABC-2 type transport system permease protein [Bogoriella caseilytica]
MSDTLTTSDARPAPVQVSLWTTYRTLLRWNVAQIGAQLPLVIVVQALLAAGIIIGFGFLIPDIDPATALFLSTGAPTVLLLTIGLVIVPQGVARARIDGTFTYMRSLPLARPLLLAADMTVWLLIALPSVAVGVLVARLRYDLAYSFDWPVLIAAALLVTLMATAVGYAIAVSLQPMLAQLVSQVLVFFVLLFSPITFPANQLPAWFQSVHDVLPARPGADLLRAGLDSATFDASLRDLLILVAWCLVGVAVSVRALVRRT